MDLVGLPGRLLSGAMEAARSRRMATIMLVLLSLAFFLPGFVSLQPMDRDEPRFAQASKQMLETGDFIDIRFQEEARHKKPVGIYWLQTAAVATAEAVGLDEARRTIALYRLPSLAGAMAVVLLTYWTALAFLSRRYAFLAAALMASSVLLGVEARLAKTDAVLAATIVAAMGVLARVWFLQASPATASPVPLREAILFWVAIAVGILVKGPITPFIVFLAMLVLAIHEREFRWLAPLRWRLGLAIVALLVLPWLVAIGIMSGGSFFEASLGQDMFGKVTTGQEKHWGPPTLYFWVFWATFWPVAPLVALAFSFIWRERRDDGVLFLLAWVVPAWIVFELVPTKLPHYVLPLYPALAILAMMAVERNAVPFHWRSAKLAAALLLLVPLALLVGGPLVFWMLDRTLPWFALPVLVLAFVVAMLGTAALMQGQARAGIGAALLASLLVVVAAFPLGVPQLKAINLSPRLAEAARGVNCASPAFATAGYNEPSLVFLTSTDIELALDGIGAAGFFRGPGCRIAFVDRRHEADFVAALAGVPEKPALRTRVTGVNINGGRRLDIGVYARAE
jgi:4-amino-4-deoxy-L-arabinose transferase-like glycosyltransferase